MNNICIFLSVNAIYAFANNQQPKREGQMSNYNILRAWLQIGGSGPDYINRQVDMAKDLNAWSDCIGITTDEQNKPIGFKTLRDCPLISIWRHQKLEKRLSEIEKRKEKNYDELLSFLVSIKNHWAIQETVNQ